MPFLASGYKEMLSAHPTGLIGSFLAVIASMIVMAEVMRLLLNAGNNHIRLRQTTLLTFVANSWSSTFPGGAAISTVYQFHTMRSWGVNVLVSSWFIMVSAALSTVWLVALGIVSVLLLGASISLMPLVISSAILLGLAALVWWATNNPEPTKRFVVGIVRRGGKLIRRPTASLIASIEEHFDQLHTVELSPLRFSWIAFLSLMNWVFDIIALWLCVWAVTGVLPGIEAHENNTTIVGVALAFVTAKVVGTAQVTPAGIGPVEAAMTGSLVAVGMTASSAFGVVFVYRILSFAIITLLGWVLYFISTARGGLKARNLESPFSPKEG